ncbi:hypothetical protein OOZ63_14175 [Paucibacter sp. PLA-PC-4]|uniref:hypothetical protein n=1 Tax=Paucibacter sp. PLA-PC-4 TaxID=2993655 RepID=UPI0022490186|nr:hypothetical protein [Paucibacter sp. PLA-PC-4]MCX2862974.1 hypothetical protein [Paucibacter sp. PLA-PC-4]
MPQALSNPVWPACERLLAGQITARIERHAALQRAEERTRERLKSLSFVDTRPALTRSEAFAEDLMELTTPIHESGVGRALMRGLAGVALGRRLA